MLIDSHCHLINSRYQKSAKELVEEAKAAGVEKIINVSTSLEDITDSLKVADEFDGVYATAGIYPHESIDIELSKIQKALKDYLATGKKVVAVGECGIDITDRETGRNVKEQLELFEMQLGLAEEMSLPVTIHNRNADKHIISAVEKFKDKNIIGVVHCFSSSWEFAKKMLDLGFYISFSGTVTYPSATTLMETVEKVPMDRFLVETDAPYLPPQKYRGNVNEPRYVVEVIEKIAHVKNVAREEAEKFSYENTVRIFNL